VHLEPLALLRARNPLSKPLVARREHEAVLFCSALSAIGVVLLVDLYRWRATPSKKLLALVVSNATHSRTVKAQFPGATQGSAYLCACFVWYSIYPTAFSQNTQKPTLAGPSPFLPPANTAMPSFGAFGTNFLTAGDKDGVTLWEQGPNRRWWGSSRLLAQFKPL